MKKLIGASVILCMLISAMTLGAFAAPTMLWDFGEGTGIEDYMGMNSAPNALTWEAKEFYHIFTANGGDPYVSIDMSADDVSQIVWVKARVLNKSYASAIELFGATDGRSLAGPECTHINITPNKNEWETVITYIPDANVETVNKYKAVAPLTETYWQGPVNWIRLDPMWSENPDGLDTGGDMAPDEEIYIDYIAFFATEEEAKAYMSPEEKAEADASAAAEAEATAADTPAEPAAEAPADSPVEEVVAPQTADLISAVFAAAVFAAGVTYELLRKRK